MPYMLGGSDSALRHIIVVVMDSRNHNKNFMEESFLRTREAVATDLEVCSGYHGTYENHKVVEVGMRDRDPEKLQKAANEFIRILKTKNIKAFIKE